MPDELVFSVDRAVASRAQSITLAEAGLTERADLQEWVIANPEILGSNVRVITFEFDRWRNASGEPERDRLDVLGLDPDGHLVVAELKCDRAPDTVEMHAIKYAAMASRFTPDSGRPAPRARRGG
jgi:RecB family endonuclease NucS